MLPRALGSDPRLVNALKRSKRIRLYQQKINYVYPSSDTHTRAVSLKLPIVDGRVSDVPIVWMNIAYFNELTLLSTFRGVVTTLV